MRPVTLTHIETVGIQEYIFGSNNLRQNVGASESVTRATTEWLARALHAQGIATNVVWNKNAFELKFGAQTIADDTAQAEVIYAGGGNALALFAGDSTQLAKDFTRQLTRQVLGDARGLSLVIESATFDWDDPRASLAQIHQQLRRDLVRRKHARATDTPLTGVSVTAACEFTGLPVVGRDFDGRLVSQVVKHKLRHFEPVVEGEQKFIPADRHHRVLCGIPDDKEFVYDFDQFGEKGKASYIAVVHTDGNCMGKRFQAIAEQYPAQPNNADYIKHLRALSDAVNQKGKAAVQATTQRLLASYQNGKYAGITATPDEDRFPFRLIVFGGDDTTFVTDGRLGLSLAAFFLQKLGEGNLPKPTDDPQQPTGDPLYARAGIAIVKSHFPFSRAYQLAASLAHQAKLRIQELNQDAHLSAFDWHVSTSGVMESLADIRAREYVSQKGNSLLQRPLVLGQPAHWQSWETFAKVMQEFTKPRPEGKWAGRRNKIKALQDALRLDEDGVKQFIANYRIGALPPIDAYPQMATQGWSSEHCGYFDALEACDFFAAL